MSAEIENTPAAPRNLTYRYQWRVNGRIVEGEREETLNLSAFQKGDLVAVTVSPAAGQSAGFPVESQPVLIHAIPPSLELKDVRQSRKAGEPLELQLAGSAPDGAKLTFNLVDPLVAGMTIDPRSGRITWQPQAGQKGPVRFGASAEDDNTTKVTKIFEISIQ